MTPPLGPLPPWLGGPAGGAELSVGQVSGVRQTAEEIDATVSRVSEGRKRASTLDGDVVVEGNTVVITDRHRGFGIELRITSPGDGSEPLTSEESLSLCSALSGRLRLVVARGFREATKGVLRRGRL